MRCNHSASFTGLPQSGHQARDSALEFNVGESVQIGAVLARKGGNLTYVYMQRGIVESRDAVNALVRIVAAPPHYPYLHPLNSMVVEVPLSELKPAPIKGHSSARLLEGTPR